MTYNPIAFIAPNYRDYNNYWLKAYKPGTTTPKSMALDSGGAVTVAKLQLNAGGFLVSAGGALVIPYIEGSYDLWLFPTEAEADANDTSEAERLADDINSLNTSNINNLSLPYVFNTASDAVAFSGLVDGKTCHIKENIAGNGGFGLWDAVPVSGVTPNAVNVVSCTGAPTLAIVLREDGIVSAEQVGMIGDGVKNNTTIATALKDSGIAVRLQDNKKYLVDDDFIMGETLGTGQIKRSSITSPARVVDGRSAKPAIVDLHYGALRGTPWNGVEVGGIVNINITVPISIGDLTATVTDTTGLSADQLVAMLSTDGTYTTNVIRSKTATVITFRDRMEKDVSTGIKLWNFYNDQFHPNLHGFNAIADYVANDKGWNQEFIRNIDPVAIGTATISPAGANNAFNPGSPTVPANDVTASAINDGVRFEFGSNLAAVEHLVSLSLNGLGNTLTVQLRKLGGSDVYLDTSYINMTTKRLEIPFFVWDSGTYQLNIIDTTGAATWIVSDVRLYRKTDLRPDLNSGKHVLLGDSWFVNASDALPNRLGVRYPDATIVNKGVGGNKASQLVARFETDVVTENPDFVWINTGTNDYNNSISVSSFSEDINRLKKLCQDIGAQPIIFNSSVGSSVTAPSEFDLSRQYLANVFYHEGYTVPAAKTAIIDTVSLDSISVAAGAKLRFGHRGLVSTGGQVLLTEYYIKQSVSVATETLKLYEGTDIDTASPTALATLSLNSLVTADVDTVTSNNRWVFFEYHNTSASPITVQGYIHIKKTESLTEI